MSNSLGLLWQKNSKDFPLVELKKALRRFPERRELKHLRPTQVHLNPADADQIEGPLLELELVANPRIPKNHLWLTGVERYPEPAEAQPPLIESGHEPQNPDFEPAPAGVPHEL